MNKNNKKIYNQGYFVRYYDNYPVSPYPEGTDEDEIWWKRYYDGKGNILI